MIAIGLLVLMLVLVARTPWGRLSRAERFWTVAALLNTTIFFAMPVTPATSPWRPVVARVLAASAAASFALLVVGLQLRRRHTEASRDWTAPLILVGLPALFYAFFWLVGPLY
jgi:predicted permease